MKKANILILTAALMLVFTNEVNAQIEINANNNVSIGENLDYADLTVTQTGAHYGSYRRTIYGRAVLPSSSGDWGFGLYCSATKTTTSSRGRNFGVYGYAANASHGWNYGIYGRLGGTNNGAAVFGTSNASYCLGTNTGGRYAGYFHGNVKITGTAWINGNTVVTSDINNKKNIRNLDKGNSGKIKNIQAIKYNLKTPAELAKNNTAKSDTLNTIKLSEDEVKQYNRERVGFNAQELQTVYPELVVEGQDGTLGVDYIGMIPILLEAIKEQQEMLEAQQKEIDMLRKGKVKL